MHSIRRGARAGCKVGAQEPAHADSYLTCCSPHFALCQAALHPTHTVLCMCVCVWQPHPTPHAARIQRTRLHHAQACVRTCSWLNVQVRMQAEGKLAAGVPKKYPSAMAAYGIIVR